MTTKTKRWTVTAGAVACFLLAALSAVWSTSAGARSDAGPLDESAAFAISDGKGGVLLDDCGDVISATAKEMFSALEPPPPPEPASDTQAREIAAHTDVRQRSFEAALERLGIADDRARIDQAVNEPDSDLGQRLADVADKIYTQRLASAGLRDPRHDEVPPAPPVDMEQSAAALNRIAERISGTSCSE